MMMYGIGYGGGFIMFGTFLLLVLIIVGVYFMIHHLMKSKYDEGSHDHRAVSRTARADQPEFPQFPVSRL